MRAISIAALILIALGGCSRWNDDNAQAHFTARRTSMATGETKADGTPGTLHVFTLTAVEGWRIVDFKADVRAGPAGPIRWTSTEVRQSEVMGGRVKAGPLTGFIAEGQRVQRTLRVRIPPTEGSEVLCTRTAPIVIDGQGLPTVEYKNGVVGALERVPIPTR